ncbi:hypothetical protein [Phytoactinopolyspora mesophila]|uniref:Ceramidase n=1 Tax=Phytoactinopolyspora mesophila TaxID=2650750 RepID=A0A7K3LY60_9ACTN|nr:hypothetical protein [Phytoactinopolyspora mesophila]NDL55930.1 hypothetical protein [Phytoactinopolyspora mesophila]
MVGAMWGPATAPSLPASSDCEAFTGGFWGQPVNSVTSLAFVAVGAAILVAYRSGGRGVATYALLTAATGAGSFIFHGPAPQWSELVHDAPLVALLAYVATDAAADVLGRRLSALWWLLPTAATVLLTGFAGPGGTVAQVLVGAAAGAAVLLRFWRRSTTRRTILIAGVVLGAGALIGALSRTGGPWCDPDSLIQGHGIWHLFAAAGLWFLTPIVGRIHVAAHLNPAR